MCNSEKTKIKGIHLCGNTSQRVFHFSLQNTMFFMPFHEICKIFHGALTFFPGALSTLMSPFLLSLGEFLQIFAFPPYSKIK